MCLRETHTPPPSRCCCVGVGLATRVPRFSRLASPHRQSSFAYYIILSDCSWLILRRQVLLARQHLLLLLIRLSDCSWLRAAQLRPPPILLSDCSRLYLG